MNKLYMGIDVGSVMTKGVIIDEYDNIMASSCLYTEGDPIRATKAVINSMHNLIDDNSYQVVSVGTTGSARKLVGLLLGTDIIRNEMAATVAATVKLYPNVKTILEIGGEDSKIILLNDGVVTDYAMNSSCSAGSGIFLSSLARRLGFHIEDMAKIGSKSKNQIDIPARCTIFAESALVDKLQQGYKMEDVIASACLAVATNYVNGISKGKKIKGPIVFNGGVSKNSLIVHNLETILGENIIVNKNSHLMNALGMAIIARESKKYKIFNFDIDACNVDVELECCTQCGNKCEIVTVYKNNDLVDYWGNGCDYESIKKCVNKSKLVV